MLWMYSLIIVGIVVTLAGVAFSAGYLMGGGKLRGLKAKATNPRKIK